MHVPGGAFFGGDEVSFVADHFNTVIAIYAEGDKSQLSLQAVWHCRHTDFSTIQSVAYH